MSSFYIPPEPLTLKEECILFNPVHMEGGILLAYEYTKYY